MAESKRLTMEELHDILYADEKKPEVRTQKKNPVSEILGSDGKPLKKKADPAREAMMEQTIVSKLYQDGFIATSGNEVSVDATKKLERAYGEESALNIRRVLYKLVTGLHAMGNHVTVNGFRWEASDGFETDRNYRSEDGKFRDIRNALQGGVRADGWKGHSFAARGDDSESRSADGESTGGVQDSDSGEEGE